MIINRNHRYVFPGDIVDVRDVCRYVYSRARTNQFASQANIVDDLNMSKFALIIAVMETRDVFVLTSSGNVGWTYVRGPGDGMVP